MVSVCCAHRSQLSFLVSRWHGGPLQACCSFKMDHIRKRSFFDVLDCTCSWLIHSAQLVGGEMGTWQIVHNVLVLKMLPWDFQAWGILHLCNLCCYLNNDAGCLATPHPHSHGAHQSSSHKMPHEQVLFPEQIKGSSSVFRSRMVIRAHYCLSSRSCDIWPIGHKTPSCPLIMVNNAKQPLQTAQCFPHAKWSS